MALAAATFDTTGAEGSTRAPGGAEGPVYPSLSAGGAEGLGCSITGAEGLGKSTTGAMGCGGGDAGDVPNGGAAGGNIPLPGGELQYLGLMASGGGGFNSTLGYASEGAYPPTGCRGMDTGDWGCRKSRGEDPTDSPTTSSSCSRS